MGPRGVSSSAAARRERTACTITAIRGASRVNAQGGTLRVLRHDAAWRRVAPSHLCGAATLLQAGQLRGRQHRGLSREHRHAMAAGRKRLADGEKKSESKTIDFASVINRDCEEYEVCRLFLSTLMLCNCGNVKMHTAIEDEEGKDPDDDSFALTESMDTLRLELVDPNFKPPTEGFLAPSADEC